MVSGDRQPPLARSRLEAFIKTWGWNQIDESRFRTPEGILDVTRDSEATIKKAARKGWQRTLWREEPRVSDPVTQRLLQVKEPYLEVHGKWARGCDGGDVAVAMGAAKDHRLYEWLSKKTQNKHGQGLDLKCRCGAANPTRRHWAWDCTEFKCSPPAESPECQLGEVLGVHLVSKPREPRPASEECVQGLVDALVRETARC